MAVNGFVIFPRGTVPMRSRFRPVHRYSFPATLFLSGDVAARTAGRSQLFGPTSSAKPGAEHILENAGIQVVVYLLAGGVLAIAQQSWIAGRRSSAAGFLDLVVGAVGKAQHQVAEAFAELLLLGQQGKTAFFGRQRRGQ